MKKCIVFLFLACGLIIKAQSPDSFNFQAVVRDAGGNVLANTPVQADIKIWQSSPGTTLVLDETYNVTTNGFGLINIMVGSVNTLQMAAIDWSAGPYYIEVIIDGTSVSTTQLLSVPYALHAKTADTITESDPLFTSSPANGITAGDITSWNNKLDTEVDGSVTNELQLLTISNDTVYLSDGGFVKLPAGFDGQYSSLTGTPTNVSTFTNDAGYLTSEVDGSVTNELQALTISNDTIYLSNGGFVKLPAGFDGQYSSLIGVPTNVSSFTNDAGYLTSFTEVDPKIGTNTSGYSPKWDGTSLVTGALFQDASDNIGIGNTAPSEKLDVSGNVKSDRFISYIFSSPVNNNTMIYYGTPNTISFYANGPLVGAFDTQGLNMDGNRITNVSYLNVTGTGNSYFNGNLGIGTSSPTTKLDVNGIITATGGNSTIWNTAYGWGNHAAAGYLTSFTEQDTMIWKKNTGNIYFNPGNVGIGTSSPVSKLSVDAGSGIAGVTIKKSAGSDDFIQFITSTGNKHLSVDYTGQLAFQVGASGPIYFGNFNNATSGRAGFSTPMQVIMGIDAATHRFGVGGTGTYFVGNAPAALLEVRGKANELQLAIQAGPGQAANLTEWRNSGGTALSVVNNAGNFGIGKTNPTEKLDVLGNAKFGASGMINIWEWTGVEKIGLDYNPLNGDFNMRNPVAGKRLLGTISNTGSWGIENVSGTELVRITGSGDMGIGTLSPATKLDVNGVITATGGNSTQWNESYTWGDHATAGYASSTHTHLEATTSTSGFMSAADKTKIDGLENANITAGQGISVTGTYPNITVATSAKPAAIRWNVFDTYDNGVNWAMGNDASLFGGVNPSSWTDGNYTAANMSSDKEILRTLLNRKCYPGKNAMVLNEQFYQVSSTTGRVAVVLMRVKNNTSMNISWTIYFHYSSYGSWNEYAGVAVNGTNVWNSGGSNGLLSTSVNVTIPANRTSTIIINSPSGPTYAVGSLYLRTCRLAFYNNCLQLPAGLEFVDDLDYATGGWEQ